MIEGRQAQPVLVCGGSTGMRAQKKTLVFCRSYKADRLNLGSPLFLDLRDGKDPRDGKK